LAIIALTVLSFNTLNGQEAVLDSLYRLTGFTVHAADSNPAPNVHVLNLSKGTGTVSSADGSFELFVRDLDTLKFSCVGMRDHYIHINASILRPDLLVFLRPDTIMMEEVRISPLPPRRFFRYVFLDTKLPQPDSPHLNLGPMMKADPGYVPPTGIRFGGPVQALYDAFNKKARLERKLRNNRKKYSKYLVPEAGDSLVYPR
jgi:hypothetical protein